MDLLMLRRFLLQADGVTLAEGVEFSDGHCVLRLPQEPGGAAYVWLAALEAVEARYCGGGNATLVLLD